MKVLEDIEHILAARKDLMNRLIESEEVLWLEELASWQGANSSSESDGMSRDVYHHASTMERYQSLSSDLIKNLQVCSCDVCRQNDKQPSVNCLIDSSQLRTIPNFDTISRRLTKLNLASIFKHCDLALRLLQNLAASRSRSKIECWKCR